MKKGVVNNPFGVVRYLDDRRHNPDYDAAWLVSKGPEYNAWRNARRRTTDPKNPGWHNYGARGIRMCREWFDSFDAFLRDVGRRPGPEYTLDRIDNDGHYEPGNVRWATRSEQQHNKRYLPERYRNHRAREN